MAGKIHEKIVVVQHSDNITGFECETRIVYIRFMRCEQLAATFRPNTNVLILACEVRMPCKYNQEELIMCMENISI